MGLLSRRGREATLRTKQHDFCHATMSMRGDFTASDVVCRAPEVFEGRSLIMSFNFNNKQKKAIRVVYG